MNATKESPSIFDTPAYSASEAARILNLPAATLKAWSFGQNYRTPVGKKKFQPVICPADTRGRLLLTTKVAPWSAGEEAT